MKTSSKLTTLFTFIVLLALSACSPASQTPEINPTQGAQLLAGEYTTTITAEDVKNFTSLDPNLASNQGDWSLSLTNKGKFTAHPLTRQP